MKRPNVENFTYKLGSWMAIVIFACLGACLTGVAVALTAWMLRALFMI